LLVIPNQHKSHPLQAKVITTKSTLYASRLTYYLIGGMLLLA